MGVAREQFGSRIGFVLAAAGSAVGIGNIVGFPVAATKNGGGAFLLIYAIMVFALCLPVMLAEFALGRHTKKDPLGAFSSISHHHPLWRAAGFLAVLTPYMIAVFYMVITVWIFGFLVHCVTGRLELLADPNYFGNFIKSPSVFGYLVVVTGISAFILLSGVQKGIERAAKVLMPALLTMLLGLTFFVLTLDNAFAGVKYYLVPDLSKINSNVINGALSQAFFSLSLGMGIMITYGSYMDKKSNLTSSAKMVALMDTSVAFLAGLLIIPTIFSFNPNTNTDELSESSVSLIFTFLPKIFLALQTTVGYLGASIVASVFFLLVFFAAITSLVSITEVPIAAVMDERRYSRRKALVVVIIATTTFTIACTTSFGMIDGLTNLTSYAGANKSLFDIVVDIFYDTILPLNGFLICMVVIYRWKKSNFNIELEMGDSGPRNSLLERYVDFSLGTIIPAVLLLIFINTVALKFFAVSLIG